MQKFTEDQIKRQDFVDNEIYEKEKTSPKKVINLRG